MIVMPMTHAPETGTENWYQKTGTMQFSGRPTSYQMKLEAKLLDYFFYTTVSQFILKH